MKTLMIGHSSDHATNECLATFRVYRDDEGEIRVSASAELVGDDGPFQIDMPKRVWDGMVGMVNRTTFTDDKSLTEISL
jgi:hypothetical protein